MRAVNLLPGDNVADGRKLPPPPALAACVGIVLATALIAVMFLSASGKAGQQQRALDETKAVYAALPVPPAANPAQTELPQQKTTRTTALASVLGQRVAWDRLLREVSQVVPGDVWLQTLDAQSPALAAASAAGATPGTVTQTFTVAGCTYSHDSVARFLARLAVVPDLSGMTLGKSQRGSTAPGGDSGTCPKGMVSFTLRGAVRAGGASS